MEDRVRTGLRQETTSILQDGSGGRALEGWCGTSAPVFVPSDPVPGGSDLLLSLGSVLFLLLQEVSQAEDELSLSFWELMRI